MNAQRLIIHAGFHKSGTTAVQESLYAQREALLEQGVNYLNIRKKAHHSLAFALTERTWGWKRRGGKIIPNSVWAKAARRINRSKAQTVLLSSEFFSELSKEKIEKLANSVRHREIEVIFTIRPLAKLLASSYQQYLKYGTKSDYSTWLHSVLDEVGISKVNPTFWLRHLHGKVVANWVEVFGAAKVSVVVVDESRPEFLFNSMNQIIGLQKGTLVSQQRGSNRSLSLEELSVLLEINKLLPKERDWLEYLTFVRNGFVRELTDNIPVQQGHSRLLTPKWAIEKANGVASHSKKEIISSGARVFGDIETLDNVDIQSGDPEYSKFIDVETVAKVILSFDRRVMRRLPPRWLFSEMKRRAKSFFRGGFFD